MIFVNGKKVEFGIFPNGESYLNFNNINARYGEGRTTVSLKYESDTDLFNLYILKNWLDSIECEKCTLDMAYMPYSRMDRQNQFYTFNLKYVCNFINSMNWSKVMIYDTHSEITDALINNFVPNSSINGLFNSFRVDYDENKFPNFCIMFPDMGAQKRYGDKFQGYNSIVGMKKRNFSDGKITSLDVIGEVITDQDVVIIDDLCSKGGTFIAAAETVKKLGAKDVYLIVSHCENSIFDGDIFKTDLIKKVYTTNSILSDDRKHEKLSVTKLY